MPEPVPFVIGVAGTTDIPAAVRPALERAVEGLLGRFGPGAAAPAGAAAGWRLAPSTPVVILSMLGPGADTLVARVAERMEKRYRQARPPGGPAWRFRVAAALPFPAKVYRRTAAFAAGGPEAVVRLNRAAANGLAFFVPLEEDAGRPPARLAADLAGDTRDPFRRDLRVRAAGEYIAAHSNMMLVLDPTTPGAGSTPDAVTVPVVAEVLRARAAGAGPAAVVEAKRQGITPRLIRAEVAFTWADAGPVVHLNTAATAANGNAVRTVLYPVDTRHEDGNVPNNHYKWARKAGELFRATLEQLEKSNEALLAPANRADERAAGELKSMVPGVPAAAPGAPAATDRRALDLLAQARRRAANLSARYAAKWDRVLGVMFWLTLLAALALHFAVHWHGSNEHAADGHHGGPPAAGQPDPPAEHRADPKAVVRHLRFGLGAGAIAVLIGVYAWYQVYKSSGQEERRYDSRALAEALRVQVYWSAAGLDASVPANYLQRQRSEMSWVRRAVTALAAPYTRWRAAFDALAPGEQLAVLRSVVIKWVRWDAQLQPGLSKKDAEKARAGAQAGYMEKSAKGLEHAEEFWHRLGFDLALVGLLQVVVWLVWLWNKTWFQTEFWAAATWLAVAAGGAFTVLWAVGFAHAAYGCLGDARGRWGVRHFGRVLTWCGDPHVPVKPGVPERREGWWLTRPWWNGLWCVLVSWHAARTGFAWSRCRFHDDRWVCDDWPKWARYAAWGVQVGVVVVLIALVTARLCVWFGSYADWTPDAETLWVLSFGSFLIAGGLSIAWPERNYMAELRHQYYAMAAMYQAAGRRLLGHLLAADAALKANDLDTFRDRVRAVQRMLHQVGQQALDENAEWIVLHRARPLEPLMAA